MAIRVMISKERAESLGFENVETVENYSSDSAAGWMHSPLCVHSRETHSQGPTCNYVSYTSFEWPDGSKRSTDPEGKRPECILTSLSKEDEERIKKERGLVSYCTHTCHMREPLYMRTTHVGQVLELREMNGYDDSDFYAKVWNEETGRIEEVQYASTRGWTYPNSAWVDATEEVCEKANALWRASQLVSFRAELEREAKAEATDIKHGDDVRVIKGRNVPVGTEGDVFWIGAGQWGARVGIRLKNGEKVFTALSNVVRANPPEVVIDEERIERHEAYLAGQRVYTPAAKAMAS